MTWLSRHRTPRMRRVPRPLRPPRCRVRADRARRDRHAALPRRQARAARAPSSVRQLPAGRCAAERRRARRARFAVAIGTVRQGGRRAGRRARRGAPPGPRHVRRDPRRGPADVPVLPCRAQRRAARDSLRSTCCQFRASRAGDDAAQALAVRPGEPTIEIENGLRLQGRTVIHDRLVLPAALVPRHHREAGCASAAGTMYQLYQAEFGITVLRALERARAVGAIVRRHACSASPPARR